MAGGSQWGQSAWALTGPAPGALVAGYRVESRIGAGGMAMVLRAQDEALGRTVALKILAPALAADQEFRERFVREARAVAAVDHPHIIPVYAAGQASGVLYLAMRFVEGSASSTGLTGTGQFLGTPDYAAPEQISGKAARPQTDQYALACVVYTVLTGSLPFARDESMAVLWAHMYDQPPSLTAARPDLLPAADGVLARGLAKVPEATTTQANAAGKADGVNNFIAPLTAAKGVASRLGHGTGVVEAEYKGHYLILTWSEFVDGTTPSTKAQDTQLERFSDDLVAGTANIGLSQRMVAGASSSPTAAAG